MLLRFFFKVLLGAFTFLVLSSCSFRLVKANEQTDLSTDGNSVILCIKRDIDLNGASVALAPNVVLMGGGGHIMNGVLIGNKTRIKRGKRLFKNITIKGDWIVPIIKSSFFCDLNYMNSLQDVFALTSDSIYNRVYISKGSYVVSSPPDRYALAMKSNTSVLLEGTITLFPNDYQQSYIIAIKNCSNVIFQGGVICGDRNSHLGNKGEWGMGFAILNSNNIVLSSISVNDCWGDCIYIGDNSKNISITDCILSGGRRQGISITSGDNVSVSKTTIMNISGTAPEYAINVEPNKGKNVNNIKIDRVNVTDCSGGFAFWGGADNATIGSVELLNSSVSGQLSKIPISSSHVNSILIDNCTVIYNGDIAVSSSFVDSLVLRDNTISVKGNNPIQLIKNRTIIMNNNSIGPR